jgi:hypothetical protein
MTMKGWDGRDGSEAGWIQAETLLQDSKVAKPRTATDGDFARSEDWFRRLSKLARGCDGRTYAADRGESGW